MGAMVTDERDDIPEDTTVTRGVLVIAMVVETSGIMNYKKGTT